LRRTDAFIVASVAFTVLVFAVYRTPFAMYMGLLYALVIYLGRERVGPRDVRVDAQSILGAALLAISPVFLFIRLGEYTSPSAFHALALIGSSLLLFNLRGSWGPLGVLGFELFLSLVSNTEEFSATVARLSDIFVDVTSYLVRGLIDITGVPITMRGNVAIVRNTIVIIGSGCSGLDAFVLYLLAALLLVYLRRSGKREAALLLLGACGHPPAPAGGSAPSGGASASCSSARSCEDLGIRYITGDGVRTDGARAARYLEKACSYGSASACNSAAFIYANAEGGAKQDYTKAMRYWSRACRLGDESGCANYKLAQDKLAALRAGKYGKH
jgi:hypothetical protein